MWVNFTYGILRTLMRIQVPWDGTSAISKELPSFWRILLRPNSVSWPSSGSVYILKMAVEGPSTLVTICLSTRLHILEGLNLLQHRCENLKTFKSINVYIRPYIELCRHPVWTSCLQEEQATTENVRVSGSIQYKSTCRIFVLVFKTCGRPKTVTVGKWNPALHP